MWFAKTRKEKNENRSRQPIEHTTLSDLSPQGKRATATSGLSSGGGFCWIQLNCLLANGIPKRSYCDVWNLEWSQLLWNGVKNILWEDITSNTHSNPSTRLHTLHSLVTKHLRSSCDSSNSDIRSQVKLELSSYTFWLRKHGKCNRASCISCPKDLEDLVAIHI